MTVMERVQEHYNESLEYFDERSIVGVFLQGSQNYGLDIPGSDVDTKMILTPSFKDIAMNRKPVSTTHIRANEEHTDWKDIRLYIETFRKQNLNFLEILFTPYYILNPLYKEQWERLIADRELIARMNPHRAVKSMVGVALEKYHALTHPYPSKLEILAKYGYDPKQLHHLFRVENYLRRYIEGEPYVDCLDPKEARDWLIEVKMGKYHAGMAQNLADASVKKIKAMEEEFCSKVPAEEDPAALALLQDVQYEIMKIAVKGELEQ